MKKKALILTAALLLCLSTACSSGSGTPSAGESTVSEASTAASQNEASEQISNQSSGEDNMVKEEFVDFSLPYADKGEKNIRVYVPAHQEGETFPVVYMTDGQNIFDEGQLGCWQTDEAVRTEQKENGKAAVIVGIYNDGSAMERSNDLTPKGIAPIVQVDESSLTEMERQALKELDPRGEVLGEFILTKVMPEVEKRFPVKTGRENTAFCGSSSGGLESFYMGMNSPEVFSMAGVFSPIPLSEVYEMDGISSWMRQKSESAEMLPFLYFYSGDTGYPETECKKGMEDGVAILKEFYPQELMKVVVEPGEMHNESAWEVAFVDFLHLFLNGSES